jgi:ribonuclease-3
MADKTQNFEAFEKRLGVSFNDKEILRQAFTHRSYLNENKGVTWGHNERLEFLGDAVLELVMTDYLYRTYPNDDEGKMTTLRSALVKADTLASIGVDMAIGEYMLLSRGEQKDLGRARQYILANAVEAILGAVYLDQGYDAAKQIIEKYLVPKIEGIIKEGLAIDSKSKFQAHAQEHFGITPVYKTIKETGPDHDKHFTVGVYLKDELIASGEGDSKQVAEQNAARLGLIAKGY